MNKYIGSFNKIWIYSVNLVWYGIRRKNSFFPSIGIESKSDDNTMYSGFFCSFTAPLECPICKYDFDSIFSNEFFP